MTFIYLSILCLFSLWIGWQLNQIFEEKRYKARYELLDTHLQELDEYSELQILTVASGMFLAEAIPEDWFYLSEEEQNDYLVDHVWEPLEGKDADYLYSIIESAADDIKELYKELRTTSLRKNDEISTTTNESREFWE